MMTKFSRQTQKYVQVVVTVIREGRSFFFFYKNVHFLDLKFFGRHSRKLLTLKRVNENVSLHCGIEGKLSRK